METSTNKSSYKFLFVCFVVFVAGYSKFVKLVTILLEIIFYFIIGALTTAQICLTACK